MDKVIIDDVDVSGCDSYSYNHNELMPYGDVKITEHYCYHVNRECNGKDCDYKQLQRLKEENKQLKKQYNCYACDSCSGKEDYINMKRHTENAIKTVHKYSQALQEIREIINDCKNGKCFTCKYNKEDAENCVDNKNNEIIAKINEVIGEK